MSVRRKSLSAGALASLALSARKRARAVVVALLLAFSAAPGCAFTDTGTFFTMGDVQDLQTAADELVRLRALGRYDEAVPYGERVVALMEKFRGPDHPDTGACLYGLGSLYLETDRIDRAEAPLSRSLAIRQKFLGPEHPDVALTLNNLGELYRRQGDFKRAKPLFQVAIGIQEKARGPDDVTLATLLSNLAMLHVAQHDMAAAEPLLARAAAIKSKALGANNPEVALLLGTQKTVHAARTDFTGVAEIKSLRDEANLLAIKGDYASAVPLLDRALLVAEKAVGPSHLVVASVLTDLARLHMAKGSLATAEGFARRALRIHEETLGRENSAYAGSLSTLSQILEAKGDPAGALVLLERAVPIAEQALGRDDLLVATIVSNLGAILSGTGDFLRAEQFCRRALEIREKALGPDDRDLAVALNNLGFVYLGRATPARALPYFERALAIFEKAVGADHPDIATPLDNLGLTFASLGDNARAEQFYLRALAIREKALGVDHPGTARTRNNLGALYRSAGLHDRAQVLYKSAVATMEKSLGPVHPDLAIAIGNLVMEQAAGGQMGDAVAAAFRVIDIQDRNAAPLLLTGAEEQKRRQMDAMATSSNQMISLHTQEAPADPEAARLAMTVVLRRKGRVLDAMVDSLGALRSSLAPGDAGLVDQLASVYSRLAIEITRGPAGRPAEQYRKSVAALDQARESLESQVAQRSAAFVVEPRLVTVAGVQAALPEGAALVEIAHYSPFHARTNAFDPPRYVAYILHRSGEPAFADLGAAAAVDEAVDGLRRALADHDRSHDPRPAARALDRLVMAPIRPLLGDARWIVLSPDGPLHLVPFGALVDEEGHYLVERYLFSYVTTGRDLLRLNVKRAAPREAALVLANPSFESSAAPPVPQATHRGARSIDLIAGRLPPLESTVEEARTIERLFPRTRVLLGAEATEEALKAAHAPGMLHLATHGFFLPEQRLPASLLGGGSHGEPTAAERTALLQRENPLLRSGIALAGFNRRRSGADDGVLTALEVAGLDLHGTRLVVLSTCESGLGEATTGEGVLGLRRALVIAGAETQVISLWQVDTGRTRELMQAYYQRLKDGRGRSEAMRDVQLAMLANRATAHPNLWASFLVSGDWRPMDATWPEVVHMEPGKVDPGLRGCSCLQAGAGPIPSGAWLALALALAAFARRRATRRSGPRLDEAFEDRYLTQIVADTPLSSAQGVRPAYPRLPG